MKILFLFCAVTAVAASSHSNEMAKGTVTPVVNNPFTEYFNIKMAAEGKILRNAILAQAKLCITEIEYFIDLFSYRIRQLGDKGVPVANVLDAALYELIASVKNAYTATKVSLVSDPIINTLKAQYFAPVQAYIDKLRKTTKGAQCYEDNKLAVKTIYDNLVNQTHNDIAAGVKLWAAEVEKAATVVHIFADKQRADFQRAYGLDESLNAIYVSTYS